MRSKDYMDNATPSGNNVAAEVLLRLAVLTGREDYSRKAVTIMRLISDLVRRYPSAFGRALGALDFYLSTPKEIVIIGDREATDTRALLREVWKPYLRQVVVQSRTKTQRPPKSFRYYTSARYKKSDRLVCRVHRQQPYICGELASQLNDARARCSGAIKAWLLEAFEQSAGCAEGAERVDRLQVWKQFNRSRAVRGQSFLPALQRRTMLVVL